MKKLLYSLVVGFAFTVLQLSTVSAQTGGMPPGMPNDGPPGMPGGPGDMNDGLGGFVPPPMPPEMEKCNMMPPGPDQVRCFDELPCDLVGPPPGIPLGEHQKVVDQCEEYQRSKGITPSSTGGMPPMDMNSGMPNDGPGMTGGPGGMPGILYVLVLKDLHQTLVWHLRWTVLLGAGILYVLVLKDLHQILV
jgi:hypothetical protein